MRLSFICRVVKGVLQNICCQKAALGLMRVKPLVWTEACFCSPRYPKGFTTLKLYTAPGVSYKKKNDILLKDKKLAAPPSLYNTDIKEICGSLGM